MQAYIMQPCMIEADPMPTPHAAHRIASRLPVGLLERSGCQLTILFWEVDHS